MKTTLLLLLGTVAWTTVTTAQTTTRTETTEPAAAPAAGVVISSGTVRSVGEGALVVTSRESSEPIRYRSTTTTRWVNEAGEPVTAASLKAGSAVTVHWVKSGDVMTAQRVVVSAPATAGTTTTTTARSETTVMPGPPPLEGTLYKLQPDSVQITTKNAKTPITLVRSERTLLVDLDGKDVPPELVKTDVPISVYYGEDGATLRAAKVLVRRHQTRLPDGTLTLTANAPVTVEETETIREEKRPAGQ